MDPGRVAADLAVVIADGGQVISDLADVVGPGRVARCGRRRGDGVAGGSTVLMSRCWRSCGGRGRLAGN